MHEEVITTTSTAASTSKLSNNTIINATTENLHQSHDGTVTVSIVHHHPHQHQHHHHADIMDYITTATSSSNALSSNNVTNQIIPSQTKIIISNNDLHSLKNDISSVIINGTIENATDPNAGNNILIVGTNTCDSDKNSLNIINQTATAPTSSSHAEAIEIEIRDVNNSANDETSSIEGESNKQKHSI